MKTEKIYLLTNDGSDYVITQTKTDDGELFELFTGTKEWTSPNTFLASVLDTGDNFKFKFDTTSKLKSMDYADAEYFKILLHFANKDSVQTTYTVMTEEYTF